MFTLFHINIFIAEINYFTFRYETSNYVEPIVMLIFNLSQQVYCLLFVWLKQNIYDLNLVFYNTNQVCT